jgi:hypothetical protein
VNPAVITLVALSVGSPLVPVVATEAQGLLAARNEALDAQEPPILEVQRRALAAAQLDAGRLDGLRAGATWRALLPVLEVSGGYSQSNLDESTILDEYSATTPWVLRGAGGQAYEARAKVSWDLSRLAYSGDVLDVTQLLPMQNRVVERATELFFRRRRLRAELERSDLSAAERRERSIAVEEATALLSGLTGGWFGEQVSLLEKNAPPARRE